MTSRDELATEVDRIARLYAAQSRINQAIVRLPTRDDLFARVCQVLVEHGGFTMTWIGWHDDATLVIEPVARWGDDHGYVDAITIHADGRPGGGPTAAAFATGRAAVSNDVRIDPVMQPWLEATASTSYRSTAALPIRENGEVHGTLNVYSDEADFFQDKEVALLQEAVIDISFGLDNLSREQSRAGAEVALRESEQRLTLATHAAGIGIFDWDARTMTFKPDPGMCALYGIDTARCGGRYEDWIGRVHPSDRQRCEAAFNAAVADGDTFDADFRVVWPGGEVRTLEAHAAVHRDDAGVATRVLGVNKDVTAREESIRKLTEQAGLLDQARDAIFVRDLEMRITYWSKGAERIYGWTAAEALGSPCDTLLVPDAKAFSGANELVFTNGGWTGELRKVTKTGAAIIVESRWTLVCDAQGQPRSILVIDTDITERKKLEAQVLRAQRMESIGTLAGGIAHDLNNVFTPIVMSLELLKADTSNPNALELIEVVSASAQRGAEMIKQVLQFARGVDGMRLAVEVRPLLRDVERILRDTFPKNIEVRIVAPGPLLPILGDRTQLHQVLMNLCVNARDAMPMGGTMVISADNVNIGPHNTALDLEAPAGEYVVLQVQDDGTGMPSDTIAKIFDPFFTTKDVGKGTGLGLSTSLAIVKGHGGFIRVYSELGKGSKFTLYFPADVGPPTPTARVVAPALPRGNGELVLLVDDEASVRNVIRKMLETFGYRVVVAADGAEAVAIFAGRKNDIAVVLTDMMMPVMDGPATIEVLLRLKPDIRIIAASGLNADGHVWHTTRLGVKHFLPKPYTAQTLLTVLRDILQGVPSPTTSVGATS